MVVEEFLKFAAVYALGVISSIAVFRSRFIRIDDRFQREKELRDLERKFDKETLATERKHDKEMLDLTLGAMRRSIAKTNRMVVRMERRQLFTQELTADIARKLGVHHRIIDGPTRDGNGDDDDDDNGHDEGVQ